MKNTPEGSGWKRKPIAGWCLGVVACLSLGAASLSLASPVDRGVEQVRELEFFDVRGGLAVGPPYEKHGDWWLPVRCDASGFKRITGEPRVQTEKMAWARNVVSVEGSSIFLTVHTALLERPYLTPDCEPAKLPEMTPGLYQVFYLNPDGTAIFLADTMVE